MLWIGDLEKTGEESDQTPVRSDSIRASDSAQGRELRADATLTREKTGVILNEMIKMIRPATESFGILIRAPLRCRRLAA
jgi:hypothetical protein